MIKRRHGASLSRNFAVEEDVNPNSYIVNLSDCMLVLMLGLIVALISYYNIDLTQSANEELIGVQVNLDENQDGIVDENFEMRGSVYYDTSSGDYYFVRGEGV